MVTDAAGFAIDRNEDGDGTTAIGSRRAMAVLFKQSSPGVAVTGRLGSDHLVVAGTSAWEYTVSGGGLVISRSGTGGAYIIGVPTGVTVATTAADSVNPRIDVIYALQPDPALDGEDVGVEFVIDVAKGTPAASPNEPSLPTGAVKLAQKRVTPGDANTAAGSDFTDVLAVTTLNVGVLGFPNGGHGATTKVGARSNLGITSGTSAPSNDAGENGDIYFQII